MTGMTGMIEAIWARQVMQPLTQPPPVAPEREPLQMRCPCGRIASWQWRYRNDGGATDYHTVECVCEPGGPTRDAPAPHP